MLRVIGRVWVVWVVLLMTATWAFAQPEPEPSDAAPVEDVVESPEAPAKPEVVEAPEVLQGDALDKAADEFDLPGGQLRDPQGLGFAMESLEKRQKNLQAELVRLQTKSADTREQADRLWMIWAQSQDVDTPKTPEKLKKKRVEQNGAGFTESWSFSPLEEAIFTLEDLIVSLEGEAVKVQAQLDRLMRVVQGVELRVATLSVVELEATEEKPTDPGEQALVQAEQEKAETAEAKEEIQIQLEKAEAERDAVQVSGTQSLDLDLEALIEREPQLLAEKFYILDRRGNEFSAELEANSKQASALKATEERALADMAEIENKIDLRDNMQKQHERASAMFSQMVEMRGAARKQIQDNETLLPIVAKLLEDARREEVLQLRQVDAARAVLGARSDDQLRRKAYRVAQVELGRREAHVKLLELRLQVLQARYQMAHEALRFARRTQESLLPLLSSQRQEKVYALNDTNVAQSSLEFVDFWLLARCFAAERWSDFWGHSGEGLHCHQATEEHRGGGIVDFLLLLLKAFGLAVMAWVCVSYLRAHRESLFKNLEGRVRMLHLGRRTMRFLHKVVEIGKVVAVPVVLWLFLNLILSLFEATDPLVVLARVLISSMLLYLIVLSGLKTLVLPRWFREGEEQPGPASTMADEDDLLEVDLQRAQFIVSTLRLLLLYTLVCQYSLFLARSALGMFFVAHWVSILGYLGYVVIIYVLLSRWRDAIAAQFSRMQWERFRERNIDGVDEEGAVEEIRAVRFVNTRKNRFYGVLVIFGAFVYVYSLELFQFVRRVTGRTESARRFQNFWFRKQLELSQQDTPKEPRDRTPLPEGLKACFGKEISLTESLLVQREHDLTSLEGAFRAWRQGAAEGSWALVGEAGMGRTVVLDRLEARWASELEVRRVVVPARVTTSAQMLSLLAEGLGLSYEPSTVDDLMEAALSLPPVVVMLDSTENCFLRCLGGFEALKVLQSVVRLGNQQHFWLLSFQNFAWAYINRFGELDYPFCDVYRMKPWSEEEIRNLVEFRTSECGFTLDYQKLSVASSNDPQSESVQSARGYFRLLTEYSKGNPQIAMYHWLRSLTLMEDKVLEVTLFEPGRRDEISKLSGRMKFVLAAIVLHGNLSLDELAQVNNIDPNFSSLAIHYLDDLALVLVEDERVSLRSEFLRQTLRSLLDSNFLYV